MGFKQMTKKNPTHHKDDIGLKNLKIVFLLSQLKHCAVILVATAHGGKLGKKEGNLC